MSNYIDKDALTVALARIKKDPRVAFEVLDDLGKEVQRAQHLLYAALAGTENVRLVVPLAALV